MYLIKWPVSVYVLLPFRITYHIGKAFIFNANIKKVENKVPHGCLSCRIRGNCRESLFGPIRRHPFNNFDKNYNLHSILDCCILFIIYYNIKVTISASICIYKLLFTFIAKKICYFQLVIYIKQLEVFVRHEIMSRTNCSCKVLQMICTEMCCALHVS